MFPQVRRASLVLALLMVIAALTVPGIFMWPVWSWGSSDYFEPMTLFMGVLRLCFILFPSLAFYGLLQKRPWALYFMVAFPAVAWLFGAGSVPFISGAFPQGQPRLVAVTLINLSTMLIATWLLLRTRGEPSKV